MAIKLIVGLQNPGSTYEHTRHNAGSWFVQSISKHFNFEFKPEKKFKCLVASGTIEQFNTKLLLPMTFMNISGESVQSVAKFYDIQPDEILVVHDELDLTPGRVKLKTGGGHGGHNGLKDIIKRIGSPDFHRLRIGIGHPGHRDLVHNYVLSKPSVSDRQQIFDAMDRVIHATPRIVSGKMAEAMNIINS